MQLKDQQLIVQYWTNAEVFFKIGAGCLLSSWAIRLIFKYKK